MASASSLIFFLMPLLTFFYLCLVSNGEVITATGCFKCQDESETYPIAEANVFLRDADIGFDDEMGKGTTDSSGCFEITGSGGDLTSGPDVFVELKYESLSYAQRIIDIRDNIAMVANARTAQLKDVSGSISFFNTTLSDNACKNYVHFAAAIREFQTTSGLSLPFQTLTVCVNFAHELSKLHSFVFQSLAPFIDPFALEFLEEMISKVPDLQPFTLYNKVFVFATVTMTVKKAKHELGHAIRHTYDGDILHFIQDVASYLYGLPHTCEDAYNEGFAFNEGVAIWNAYWNEFSYCTDEFGSASGSKDVEANVASALKKILTQPGCPSSYGGIWEVLKNNPGKIHSFNDFCYYACTSYEDCISIGVYTTPPPTTVVVTTTAVTNSPSVCSSRPELYLYSGYSSSGLGHLQESVKMLQNMLNMFHNAGLIVDGYFGPLTESAVQSYQTSRGLDPDGIVGPLTWGALCSEGMK